MLWPFYRIPNEPSSARRRRCVAASLMLLAAGLCGAEPLDGVRWSSYRDFWFAFGSTSLDASDAAKVADVAAYARSNPTHRLGIDGASSEDAELGAQRVASIRAALIRAGVPEGRIDTGEFGSAQLRRARRVEVLVSRGR